MKIQYKIRFEGETLTATYTSNDPNTTLEQAIAEAKAISVQNQEVFLGGVKQL